jgi:hypothetical protein
VTGAKTAVTAEKSSPAFRCGAALGGARLIRGRRCALRSQLPADSA